MSSFSDPPGEDFHIILWQSPFVFSPDIRRVAAIFIYLSKIGCFYVSLLKPIIVRENDTGNKGTGSEHRHLHH